MGKGIIKVNTNNEERFLVWSSTVDAPVTFACTEKEIVAYFVEEAVERAKRDVAFMLERARSPLAETLADVCTANRAGPEESELSEDEITEFYVRRKEDPTKAALAAYRKGRR